MLDFITRQANWYRAKADQINSVNRQYIDEMPDVMSIEIARRNIRYAYIYFSKKINQQYSKNQ